MVGAALAEAALKALAAAERDEVSIGDLLAQPKRSPYPTKTIGVT